MNKLTATKKILRKMLKEYVNILEEEYINFASLSIYEKIIMMPEYINSNLIFCFVGTPKEINTRLIIIQALKDGKRIGVPKCVELGIMNVYEVKSLDDLELGKYDIYEPKEYCEKIEKKQIDLGIIPCLSCNLNGERIGYGGGFYDRYLKNASFIKMVVCMEKLMQENIPSDELDIKMDIVVNENKIVKLIEEK